MDMMDSLSTDYSLFHSLQIGRAQNNGVRLAERPRNRRTAQMRDEIAPFHLITSLGRPTGSAQGVRRKE
jgi:hypothetical protein